MDVYLDISGTIIVGRGKVAKHLAPFLSYLTENHRVYWLSTLCKGDSNEAHRYLQHFLPKEMWQMIKLIPAAPWHHHKTEAIDFDKDFRWFDDGISDYDREILEENGRMEKLVLVDHNKNPDFFRDFEKYFE